MKTKIVIIELECTNVWYYEVLGFYKETRMNGRYNLDKSDVKYALQLFKDANPIDRYDLRVIRLKNK